ncbi:hypothetical protein CL657_00590 [bacterium]|nr:hypothetical protein [bacterium]|tara:strand:- start:1026 stop:1937 length:912 start_codon:yes stop_codon:yes gene_type:complete
MKYLTQTDKFFWVFIISSIILGLNYPQLFLPYEGYIIYIIMFIMGLLFLKVDIIDVVTHIKRPLSILYISCIKLIILPILVYFIFIKVDPTLHMSLFLLASLPTGVTSALFTDIMNGRTSLNLTAVIITNLLSIFTIPFLFFIFFNTDLNLNYMLMFTSLLKIIIIPFLAAKLIKRVFIPNIIQNLQSYLNFKIIILLSCMITISISVCSQTLIQTFSDQLYTMIFLFACFLGFHLIGYFSMFWKSKGEKLAISNSCMIMNNILGIVLAIACFDQAVLNIMVLSLIPWNIMIIIKHFYKRYLP